MNAKQLAFHKHVLLFAMVILEGPAVDVKERGVCSNYVICPEYSMDPKSFSV